MSVIRDCMFSVLFAFFLMTTVVHATTWSELEAELIEIAPNCRGVGLQKNDELQVKKIYFTHCAEDTTDQILALLSMMHVTALSFVENIRLRHNAISDVSNTFNEAPSALKSIDLSYNQINSLDHVLSQLPVLKNLFLSHNQIAHIDHALNALPELKLLWLDNNRLESLGTNAFAGLEKLRLLWLKNNLLQSVDAHILSALTELRYLNLAYNQLESIDIDILTNKLARLDMSGNMFSVTEAISIFNQVKERMADDSESSGLVFIGLRDNRDPETGEALPLMPVYENWAREQGFLVHGHPNLMLYSFEL